MASPSVEEAVTLRKQGRIAIITLNQPKKLNALNQDQYFRLAYLLHEVAAMEDVYITVLAGTGRFFSAGADVSISRASPSSTDPCATRRYWLQAFVSNNLHITHAFYTHPKILVTALNGPVIGLSAALIAFSDFIYAAPHAFLLTPFTSLGLVAEGGASVGLVQRLGLAKANEALIMSKKIGREELVRAGFVNEVFDAGGPENSEQFLAMVLKEVDERLGEHLNQESMIRVKALIRRPMLDLLDKQGVKEVMGGLERFIGGYPQEEFRRIADGEKKHKL